MNTTNSVNRDALRLKITVATRAAVLLLCFIPGRTPWADAWFDTRLVGSNMGVGLVMQAHSADEDRVHALRAMSQGCIFTCRPRTKFDDLSAISYMVGYRRVGEVYTMIYQAGGGLVYGGRDLDCGTARDCGSELSVGLPLTISLTLGKYVGFGAELFANINPLQPVFGMSVGWTFGKFN